jgi:hypothetical protein
MNEVVLVDDFAIAYANFNLFAVGSDCSVALFIQYIDDAKHYTGNENLVSSE